MLLSFFQQPFIETIYSDTYRIKFFVNKTKIEGRNQKLLLGLFKSYLFFVTLPFARISTNMTELGALPPGWDTKFDPRTGR